MTSVTLRTGSEGPRHDPYHYDELTVKRNNNTTTIHLGLGVWCSHNGHKVTDEDLAYGLFEVMVGMPWHVVLKALRKLEDRKAKALWFKHRHCAGEARCVAGYPGEHFVLC